MRRRSRLTVVAILLLPALLYRAFVPVGFMPARGANGALELDLCPGTVDVATFIATAASLHAHDHHQSDPGAAEPSGHGNQPTPCPYALSGKAAPLPALFAFAPMVAVDEKPLSSATISVFLPTILRAQTPRAPPTFV